MIGAKILPKRYLLRSIAAVALILMVLVAAGPVLAHGGKAHTNTFTALRALQKTLDLYDQLVGTGKLGESWETKLTKVGILSRHKKGGGTEYVVSFQRSEGEPKTVYIFFSADGKYTGSNFTGK